LVERKIFDLRRREDGAWVLSTETSASFQARENSTNQKKEIRERVDSAPNWLHWAALHFNETLHQIVSLNTNASKTTGLLFQEQLLASWGLHVIERQDKTAIFNNELQHSSFREVTDDSKY